MWAEGEMETTRLDDHLYTQIWNVHQTHTKFTLSRCKVWSSHHVTCELQNSHHTAD